MAILSTDEIEMWLKNCAVASVLIFCYWGMRTAMADELGNLNDGVYSELSAAHNIKAITMLIGKERSVATNSVDTVYCGIADDLKIINKHEHPRNVHMEAIEMLMRDKYLTQCPTGDIRKIIGYFKAKKDVLLSGFNFPDFYNLPKNRKCLDEFLAEVKNVKICDYKLQGTSRPGLDILIQAGVESRSQLTNELFLSMYDEAVRVNQQKLYMNQLQRLLDRIDRIFMFQMEHQKGFNESTSDSRLQE